MAIDWTRTAEPQADGYDARVALHLAAVRSTPGREELYVRRSAGDAPTLFDGAVAVRAIYPPTADPMRRDGPFDHPSITRAVELLRHWPRGFALVRRLIDTFHPWSHPSPLGDPSRLQGVPASHSEEALFGTLAALINSPRRLAESFLIETARQKLRAFGVGERVAVRFLTNPPGTVVGWPPGVALQRMTTAFHSLYGAAHVAELHLALCRAAPDDPEAAEVWRRRLEPQLAVLRELPTVLAAKRRLDRDGEAFVEGLDAWIARLLREATP